MHQSFRLLGRGALGAELRELDQQTRMAANGYVCGQRHVVCGIGVRTVEVELILRSLLC